MFKNLNQLTLTHVNLNYNNSNNSSRNLKYLNIAIDFNFSDLQIGQNGYYLQIKDFLIRNCIIRCPDGTIWNNLQFSAIEKKSEIEDDYDKTIFYFYYLTESDWDKENSYYIYPASEESQKIVRLYNSNSTNGFNILQINGQDYIFKKIVAGSGISLYCNQQQLVISLGQTVLNTQERNLNDLIDGIIDLKDGSYQIFYVYDDFKINDITTTIIGQNNSPISIVILLYKPNQTVLKYKDQLILNKYDKGWFSFIIKKISDHLFITQPTRIITDYEIEN